jgi:sugar lactone lactonase YvrE
MRVLYEGLAFGESPRWHGGRLWVCDWGAQELLSIGPDGAADVVARVASFPFCIDWLPDGRLLIVSAADQALLTLERDGSLGTYADLSALTPHPPGNEIVADEHGRAYVNGAGYDPLRGGAPAPGIVALVDGDGHARRVADDLAFPNGMAITPDGGTLIVAESHAGRLTAFAIDPDGDLRDRRVWAAVDGSAPDGICVDAEGAVWYADVPNRCCVRVCEGGEVLERIEADRGCFACVLGGPDGRTLFIVAREWHGMADISAGNGSGQILSTEVAVGRP